MQFVSDGGREDTTQQTGRAAQGLAELLPPLLLRSTTREPTPGGLVAACEILIHVSALTYRFVLFTCSMSGVSC